MPAPRRSCARSRRGPGGFRVSPHRRCQVVAGVEPLRCGPSYAGWGRVRLGPAWPGVACGSVHHRRRCRRAPGVGRPGRGGPRGAARGSECVSVSGGARGVCCRGAGHAHPMAAVVRCLRAARRSIPSGGARLAGPAPRPLLPEAPGPTHPMVAVESRRHAARWSALTGGVRRVGPVFRPVLLAGRHRVPGVAGCRVAVAGAAQGFVLVGGASRRPSRCLGGTRGGHRRGSRGAVGPPIVLLCAAVP